MTPLTSTASPIDRTALLAWYRRNRERSAQLFDLIVDDAYYTRPITLRNPIVFYEGHLPAFSVNTLVKKGLGRPGVDERLEHIFARGIDPDDEASASPRGNVSAWPSRDEVRAFGRAADALIEEALTHAEIDRPGVPLLDRAEAVYALLEHEAMHQETLLYMWHRLPLEQKVAPHQYRPVTGGSVPAARQIVIPEGWTTLGAHRARVTFGWDNEFDAHRVRVPAFSLDAHNVTNADFLAFLEDGGYERQDLWAPADWAWRESQQVTHPLFWESIDGAWHWRTQFDRVPLPAAWPVYVSQAEASAYARWAGGQLPTEAEFHRAAFGTPDGEERSLPWGAAPADDSRTHIDFASFDPIPAGTRAAGASAWGVQDLVGNGWEWTSTIFAPFEGFEAMPSYPEYSAEFFDQGHFVMKGASAVTARELVRASFRNWFRPHYPYVYAGFRVRREAR